MIFKLSVLLAFLGLTRQAVAFPTLPNEQSVDGRSQPWKEFKREAIENETPEMAARALVKLDKLTAGAVGA